MAQLGFNIDFNNAAEQRDFKPIPHGTEAPMTLDEIELADCNNGQMVKFRTTIVDGDYKNRKIFDQWVVNHTNQEAERIGRSKLAQLAIALGATNGCSDTDQLMTGNVFIGVIGFEKSKNPQYQDKNTLLASKPVQQQQQKQEPKKQDTPKQSAPSAGKPSWMMT